MALHPSRQFLRQIVVSALLALSATVLASAQAKPVLGDACELTQSLQTCQTYAKSKSAGSGLFVAIAESKSSTLAGIGHGQPSKAAAEQTALANCKAIGANDCQIVQSQKDTCVGFAVSVDKNPTFTFTAFGYGVKTDRTAAGAQAISECAGQGGKQCALRATPCAGDNPGLPSRLPLPSGGNPGSVDPKWVGTWELNPPAPASGRWVWQVSANGTYELHSEAFDGTPSNAGTVSAGGGRYTLHANNISWDDAGTYYFQGSGTLIATGKLGTGTWHKISGEDQ